jgi:ribosomal protein L33
VDDVNLNDVWEYDIAENSWTAKNKMPNPRALANAQTIDKKINLMFGFRDPADYNSFYTSVDEYNPAEDSWNTVASLPEDTFFSPDSYTEGTVLTRPISKADGYFTLKSGQIAPGASVTLKIEGSNDNINFVDYKYMGTVNKSSISKNYTWSENKRDDEDRIIIMKYYRLVATVSGGTCSFEVTAPHFRDFPSIVLHNNKYMFLAVTTEEQVNQYLTWIYMTQSQSSGRKTCPD